MSAVALGIDLGTSAVKCVLTRQGVVIGTGSSALSVSSPHAGWSEQDPTDWIEAVKIAATRTIQAADISPKEIKGISLSGQMHGAIILGALGEVLRPAILWNDNRSTKECAELSTKLPNIGQIAGVPPLPGFTAPKLMWLKTYEPEIFARIETILLPKDYIAFWLTGERVSDRSDAAGTLWLDQRARAWGSDLIEASGIEGHWLPKLHDGCDAIGGVTKTAADALGLARNVPVFAGGGDAAAGALSIGAASAGKCFISLGTSGQLLVVDDTYRPNPDQFVHAFCHTLPDLWYRMAAMLNGARPLSWFAAVLECSVPELLSEAERANTARIPLFLPYLTGERSPHGDPDIRAAFYDLDDATGRPEMCRAVVEAIAFMMRDAQGSFGDSFAPTGPIPVIGGGSRSDLVLQTLANVLDHPVARTDAAAEGPAFGAALLAELGMQARTLSDMAFDAPLTDIFNPINDAPLNARYARYQGLYQALRGL